jgi:hypothetical protein
MFSIFKRDPVKKLKKIHAMKLEQAMHAQRSGDIRRYSELTAEADTINQEIIALTSDATN